MTLFERVHLPSFAGATEWLNSEPLGPAGLQGRVVLVNFWTWTCINWLRQEPYVRAWSRAYCDDGLVVIGVHTPEFSFEHDIGGVRRAASELAIGYPVVVDNDYEVWNAFANRYWPALYVADAEGVIRDKHFGRDASLVRAPTLQNSSVQVAPARHGSPMLRSLTSLLLAVACALALAVTLVPSASARQVKRADAPARLYVQTGAHGSLTLVKRKGAPRYTLTLRGVAPQLVWFQDRPGRDSGHVSTRGFVGSWVEHGFRVDPPNAALTLLDGRTRSDTVIVELTRPRYDRKRRTMRYTARPLSKASGGLAHFESDRDRRVPRRFGVASLFIDDAQVIDGCTIEPYASCANANLAENHLEYADVEYGDFSGANLSRAFLQGSGFNHADFSNANLSEAYMFQSDFSDANLTQATLTNSEMGEVNAAGAGFQQAILLDANLTSANLTGADLTGAHLTLTNFTDANLSGANLTGAGLSSATFCNTTMPDASVNNSGC
jgi:hypothetical protein